MVENALPREWWMDEVWRKEGWWEQEEVGAQVRRSSDQSIGTGRRRRGIMFSTKTESPSIRCSLQLASSLHCSTSRVGGGCSCMSHPDHGTPWRP